MPSDTDESLEDLILTADYNYDRQYMPNVYPPRVTYDDWQKIKRMARERKIEEQERMR